MCLQNFAAFSGESPLPYVDVIIIKIFSSFLIEKSKLFKESQIMSNLYFSSKVDFKLNDKHSHVPD
jgi:hypothetical protein